MSPTTWDRDSIASRYRIETSGCWKWLGPVHRYADGTPSYGSAAQGGRKLPAHRLTYELFVGSIPAGLDLDHLCRNRRCVNPAHLEPVTRRENIMRSPVALPALNEAKTHCTHGHEYTPENTVIQVVPWGKGFQRACRTCKYAAIRRYSARKRAQKRATEAAS